MKLETWIATATENLAPKAAEKVREDISMHVETAVNRYQLERHGELEALELAVKDLGDAKVAARGFEKTHLTVKELGKFVAIRKFDSDKIWFSVITLGFSISLLLLNLESIHYKSISTSRFGINTMLLLSINILLNGFMARKSTIKSYIISRIFINGISYLAYIPFSIKQYLETESLKRKILELPVSGIDVSDISMVNNLFFPVIIGILVIWGLFSLQRDYSNWRKLRFL